MDQSKDKGNRGQILTDRQGHPISNNQAQRTVGSRGPATLENYHFLEKISHFDRERILKHLKPLAKQVLTEEDQRRLQQLGKNGDRIEPDVWGQWTSSVKNHPTTAEEVLEGRLPAGGASAGAR